MAQDRKILKYFQVAWWIYDFVSNTINRLAEQLLKCRMNIGHHKIMKSCLNSWANKAVNAKILIHIHTINRNTWNEKPSFLSVSVSNMFVKMWCCSLYSTGNFSNLDEITAVLTDDFIIFQCVSGTLDLRSMYVQGIHRVPADIYIIPFQFHPPVSSVLVFSVETPCALEGRYQHFGEK